MRKKLGEMLVELGYLDEPRLRTALAEQQRFGGKLGRILIESRLVPENVVLSVLSQQLNMPAVNLDEVTPGNDVLALVTPQLAEERSVIPLAVHGRFFDVAMANPADLRTIDELQARTKLNVRPHLAGPKMIERALARLYRRGHSGMMEAVAGSLRRGTSPSGVHALPTPPMAQAVMGGDVGADLELDQGGADVTALKEQVEQMAAQLARDEDVLRQLLYVLIEKGIVTREDVTPKRR